MDESWPRERSPTETLPQRSHFFIQPRQLWQELPNAAPKMRIRNVLDIDITKAFQRGLAISDYLFACHPMFLTGVTAHNASRGMTAL